MTQHTQPTNNPSFTPTACGTRCSDPPGTLLPHARSRSISRVLHVAVLISFLLVILPTVAGAIWVTTAETATTSHLLGSGSTYRNQSQSFKAVGTEIEQISVALSIGEGTPYDVTLYVRNGSVFGKNRGSATITTAMVSSTDPLNPTWVNVPISVKGLAVGTTYYVNLYSTTTDGHKYFRVSANDTNPYSDGAHYKNYNGAENSPNDLLVKVKFTDSNPPVATFTATPTSGAAPLSVTFTDQSTNSPTSWSWNFGDGQTSTAQNPSHSYSTPGTYTVSLTATNSKGSNTLTKTSYIMVTVPPPVAAFTATPTSGAVPLSVTFTDQSTNTPTSWSWNFGDGQTSTAQNPSHAYAAVGTYTVTLTATNAGGSDPEVKTGYITVINPPPGTAFTGTPTSGVAPQTVVFTDQSTNTPTSWSWNFGDGQTSSAQNPSHSYSTPGTYTVSLTATNAGGGNTLTRTSYITVTAPAPVAAFTAAPTSGNAPLTVTFTDQSTNFPAAWSWNFGDGQTSTAQNPSHSYDSPGTYAVILTVMNAAGSDSETKIGYITATVPLPVAAFTGTPVSGPVPLTVAFTDQSTNSPTSWSWNFGDGNMAITQNPSHTYIVQGIYTVTLTATNAGGSDPEIKIGYITVGNPPESLVVITSTDKDGRTAKRGDMVNVSIRLLAGEGSPMDGMILLDRSAGMASCMAVDGSYHCLYDQWDLAKEGALLLTGNASAESKLGVGWFATRGDIAQPLDSSQAQVTSVIQALNYVPYGYTPDPYTGPGTGGKAGMSNMRDGMYKSLKYLDGVPQENLRTRAVIIFSDGKYNWYGNPIAHGRGTALRSKAAVVYCNSGICENGMETNNRPYNPANVNSYVEDAMWWENSECNSGSCYIPTQDYTFYNWIKENRANGGWLNFTGLKWNGMDRLGDGAHIAYPTYTGSGGSYYGLWPARYGYTGCAQAGYIHCDENINPAQYQLDVCAPEWPYIEYINGVKVEHKSCEQTEQNMTIFARDANVRLYTVTIRTDADTGTSMPSGYASADDMMKILAYTTGGKYYAVHDRTDLYDAIEDITNDLASAATKDLTMDVGDTSVDVNSILRVNTNDQVFSHHHLQGISTTVQSWNQNGVPIKGITTIPEAQDWLSTHRLNYFVDDLSVGDTFLMNYTVQVSARGRINAIGPDSVVTFKDGTKLPLPPTYIDVENAPPVFDNLGQQTVDRMDPLTFLISATDADNDPLTYASISLPAGATFDPDTLRFEWTPGEKGIYSATFSVTDGMATVTQTVPIIVTDLQAKIVIR
jgi:PKD repeat protein